MAENTEMATPEIKAPEPVPQVKLDYTPPGWKGKPPKGAKLEVLKGGSIIETIPLEDKDFFVFGRQEGAVDVY